MATTDLLRRNSSGLSAAHIQLLKLLAELAVKDYLREIESDEPAQKNGELHEDSHD